MGALGWLINLKFRGGRALVAKPQPLQLTVVASANCAVPDNSANCVVPVASSNSMTLVASSNSMTLVTSKNSVVLV